MAVTRRQPKPGLVHHTDSGATYTSADHRVRLTARDVTPSMSRRGGCYDYAVSESFFGTLQTELGEQFESHRDAHHQLFEYIEVIYNGARRHFALG